MNDGKCWVESRRTGDLGWLVDKDDHTVLLEGPKPDRTAVRLNRGNTVALRPWNDSNWSLVKKGPRLPRSSKAAVAFEAIRALSRFRGEYTFATKELSAYPEERRIAYFTNGPKALDPKAADDIRTRLFDAIMKVLEDE